MNIDPPATQSVEARAIVLHPHDNVATALCDLKAHQDVQPIGAVDLAAIALVASIPLCHKFALRAIAQGEEVIKYGEVIGKATWPIAAGDHVHVHNLISAYALGSGPSNQTPDAGVPRR